MSKQRDEQMSRKSCNGQEIH
uniref:Uncharacterized protein n=1 Tax=Rhizophora mucronata TaxID=61149 RepID=A0A2P2R3M3_RHIMU